ncbi:hypothetical protein MMC25_002580 [Agyrium rufum]|nr:hypothetical protein [Agyrium rufum]
MVDEKPDPLEGISKPFSCFPHVILRKRDGSFDIEAKYLGRMNLADAIVSTLNNHKPDCLDSFLDLERIPAISFSSTTITGSTKDETRIDRCGSRVVLMMENGVPPMMAGIGTHAITMGRLAISFDIDRRSGLWTMVSFRASRDLSTLYDAATTQFSSNGRIYYKGFNDAQIDRLTHDQLLDAEEATAKELLAKRLWDEERREIIRRETISPETMFGLDADEGAGIENSGARPANENPRGGFREELADVTNNI